MLLTKTRLMWWITPKVRRWIRLESKLLQLKQVFIVLTFKLFSVMLESARIARGAVKPLSELTPEGADAVVFPGGFGAAKNLSDFGFKV